MGVSPFVADQPPHFVAYRDGMMRADGSLVMPKAQSPPRSGSRAQSPQQQQRQRLGTFDSPRGAAGNSPAAGAAIARVAEMPFSEMPFAAQALSTPRGDTSVVRRLYDSPDNGGGGQLTASGGNAFDSPISAHTDLVRSF